MKYCQVCKVNVYDKHENCPLCGSYLSKESPQEDKFSHYQQNISPYVSYPDVKLEDKVDFFNTRTSRLLWLIAIACMGLELALTQKFVWSFYVLCGTVFTVFCVLMPINRKFKLYNQILVDLPIMTLLSIFIELRITNFESVWISSLYVLPSLYIISILLTDAMIISVARNKTKSGYFSILILCTLFACLLRIVMWCIPITYDKITTVDTVAFFFALLNFGVVFICSYKTLREEYLRKWNM